MTDNTAIPLSKLLAWEGNVRKTHSDKGIDELAASITAHGLLQSLVVRKDKRGKYAVVAGRRRLLALQSLAETGIVLADMDIPCHVLDAEAKATEIGLVENVHREPMHPADEFDAFKSLIESGMLVTDVAARFGVNETVVKQRLKLANVSPKLVAAYRKGDMTLQHVMAFAVTDDHAAQERVWNELSEYHRDPEDIRTTLTEQEITAADRRVKFVTLKAYEKAGGTVRRDLFSEDDHGVFIDDTVLLESLVAKKLEKAANAVRHEGWKWIEIRPSFNHAEWSKCQRRHPEPLPLLPEQQSELDALIAESNPLYDMGELDEDQQNRLNAITERIEELEDRDTAWPAATLAIAGAVVTLGSDGKADVRTGYVKPEDVPKKAARTKSVTQADGTVTEVAVANRSALPASLIERLTAQRTAAINAALLERPDIALAATVHTLALQVFYNGSREDTALQITANERMPRDIEDSSAFKFVEAARERWTAQLPGGPANLFVWCLAQNGDTLRGLLTFCIAQTVNAVLRKTDEHDSSRMENAARLAEALHLDMAAWFTPTAANYFSRISKAGIIAALQELKGAIAPAWRDMKKTELATLAERESAGKGWLPEPLRPSAREASETAD